MKYTVHFASDRVRLNTRHGKVEIVCSISHSEQMSLLSALFAWNRERARRTPGSQQILNLGRSRRHRRPATKLTGFFCDGKPLSVLRSHTLVSILVGQPNPYVGEFGLALYEQAFESLSRDNRLRVVRGGLDGLENLFAGAVAAVLPGFRKRYQRALTGEDLCFAEVSGIKLPGSEPPVQPAGGQPRKRRIREVMPAPEELVREIELRIQGLPDFLTHPISDVPDNARLSQRTVARGARVAGGEPDPDGLGSYVDFQGKVRSVTALNEFTIRGLLTLPSMVEPSSALARVLDPDQPLSVDDYRQARKLASEFRRKSGFGGPEIAERTAEFYFRVARAMELTDQEVAALDPVHLKALVYKAIRRHKRENPQALREVRLAQVS